MADRRACLVARALLHDRSRFANHVSALPPVYARFGGRYLAVATPATIEQFGQGQLSQSVVISRWPSLAYLQKFWVSNEYQQVMALRAGTRDVVVAGLEAQLDAALPQDQALGLILRLGPSPALLESGRASNIECVREFEIRVLEGDWTRGDCASFSMTCVIKKWWHILVPRKPLTCSEVP